MIEIILKTVNNTTDYEVVKLFFLEIVTFRYIETYKTSNLVIKEVLLNKEDNIITVDFSPLIYDDGIKENINSDFMIKCKEIRYEVLMSTKI